MSSRGNCETKSKKSKYFPFKLFLLIVSLIIFSPLSVISVEKNKEILDERGIFLENVLKLEQKLIENQKANQSEEAKIMDNNLQEKIKREFQSIRLDDVIKNNSNFNSFSIPLAKYFLKFSSYAYCSEEKMQTQTCCPDVFTDDHWELFSEKKVSYDNYNYAILINYKYKKILTTFPGTRGPIQLIKELYYSNGVVFNQDRTEKVMIYIKDVYALFKTDLEKTLEDLFVKFGNYQFIFTGHSLGGSMAALSVVNSVKYGGLKPLQNSPMLITYGQPRVGNDVFANMIMKYVPIVYRVTRYGDIVSNIPPCYNFFLDKHQIKCKGILPDFKFDINFTMNDKQKKTSETYYFNWHTAGWKHFEDDMLSYEDCGNDYGENSNNSKCQLSLSLDINKHINYFGLLVSDIC
jgi:hypothetical protein